MLPRRRRSRLRLSGIPTISVKSTGSEWSWKRDVPACVVSRERASKTEEEMAAESLFKARKLAKMHQIPVVLRGRHAHINLRTYLYTSLKDRSAFPFSSW